jgi:hypothetical protein
MSSSNARPPLSYTQLPSPQRGMSIHRRRHCLRVHVPPSRNSPHVIWIVLVSAIAAIALVLPFLWFLVLVGSGRGLIWLWPEWVVSLTIIFSALLLHHRTFLYVELTVDYSSIVLKRQWWRWGFVRRWPTRAFTRVSVRELGEWNNGSWVARSTAGDVRLHRRWRWSARIMRLQSYDEACDIAEEIARFIRKRPH